MATDTASTSIHERAERIAKVRAEVLSLHPELSSPRLATIQQRLTTRWNIEETLTFQELPKGVQDWIRAKAPAVLLDPSGTAVIRIYPDQRPSSQSGLSPITEKPLPLARSGEFTIVTPVIAEIDSQKGEKRYIRVACKRMKKQVTPQTKRQFDRERALASWLMPKFDNSQEKIAIARPIAIGEREILYEWVATKDGQSANLAEASTNAGDYLRIAADAADALAWLHRNKVKYLDLNERNIVLNATGKGKLVDWGSARQYDDIVDEDTVFNERFYDWRLIVQQELHRQALDIADKYALGVLIRQFLLRYELGEIFEESESRRGLRLKPEFANLEPILKISDRLRQGIMHPYQFYANTGDDRDLDYLKLDTIGHTFRLLAKIMDARSSSRRQLGSAIEIIDQAFQSGNKR